MINILLLLDLTSYVLTVQPSDFNMAVTFIKKAMIDFVPNDNSVSSLDKQMLHNILDVLLERNIPYTYIKVDAVLNSIQGE
jgi:hypothetical protein